MGGNVYSVTQLYGTSQKSVEDAVETAISTASQTLRNLDWFEVTEIRGHVEGGKIRHYQVGLKIGFRYQK